MAKINRGERVLHIELWEHIRDWELEVSSYREAKEKLAGTGKTLMCVIPNTRNFGRLIVEIRSQRSFEKYAPKTKDERYLGYLGFFGK